MLGWRFLAWALERGGAAIRARLVRVFEQAETAVGLGTQLELELGTDVEVLADHGYLVPNERRRVAREGLTQVVGPAARALLGADARVGRPAETRTTT